MTTPFPVRIVLISDTHGLHREVTLPPGDILIHAGDLTTHGRWDTTATTFVNASVCTLGYEPRNPPIVVDVMPRANS